MDLRRVSQEVKDSIKAANAAQRTERVQRFAQGGFTSENSGSIRSNQEIRAFRAELQRQEDEANRKRAEIDAAPRNAAEAQFKAAAQAAAIAERDNITKNFDMAIQNRCLDRITRDQMENFTEDDWRFATNIGWTAQCDDWKLQGIAIPEGEECVAICKYLEVNSLYPSQDNIALAFSRLMQVGAIRLQAAPVVVVPEPEPVAAPLSETQQYAEDLTNDIFHNVYWETACQSICDTSGLAMSFAAQEALFKFMSCKPQYQPVLNIKNVRRAARDFWSDEQVGLTPEEQRSKDESRVFESMGSRDALKHLGIPLLNTGAAPTGGYTARRAWHDDI